jgi:hypothetical protein
MSRDGTRTTVGRLPICDFCENHAEYDFMTTSGHRWAFACHRHWRQHRLHPDLGPGRGQKLVVQPERIVVED